MKTVLREDGEVPFLESLIKGSTGGVIEAQEARGQRSFVTSDVLPVDMPTSAKAQLEAAGVTFGEVCANDPIFQFVTLPAGWSKKPTDHSMWSTLMDQDGREVAAIFYKAAFYDRSSFLSINEPAPAPPAEAQP